MPADVTLFGASYSTYVRTARLALEEKGVPYALEEVGIMAEDEPPASYYARQPFGRIPAFEHKGFRLYETSAITRYIDEAFDGPALMPADPQARARVNQVMSVIDSYAYRAMVWDVCVERLFVPQEGGTSNEDKIAGGLATAETCMTALEDLMGTNDFLAGPELTLADLQAFPDFVYFRMTPEGDAALEGHPQLAGWFNRMAGRESVKATVSPLEGEGG